MPITFNIPLDIPNIELTFWLRQFTTDTMAKRYKINYPSATLYIQKSVSYLVRQEMDPHTVASLSFAISEYNIDGIKDMFSEVASWFTSENKDLLYGVNNGGIIMFNSDFERLNAMYVNEYNGVKTVLKVVPTVVEIGAQSMEPGVVFYINNKENVILLREYQIKRLCKFIERFNFMTYTQFAMQCFQYSLITGNLLSREEMQKRLDAQRKYNSNFNY